MCYYLDYKEGSEHCRLNSDRLSTTARIIKKSEDGTDSFALFLYSLSYEEMSKSVWCLFVDRGWVSESFIKKVFRWHDSKIFLFDEMFRSFKVVHGQGYLGGAKLGDIVLENFVSKHKQMIEQYRERTKNFIYVGKKNSWETPKFNIENFDDQEKEFENKIRGMDLLREFVLKKWDKEAHHTDNFHLVENENGSYSIQFDQV